MRYKIKSNNLPKISKNVRFYMKIISKYVRNASNVSIIDGYSLIHNNYK